MDKASITRDLEQFRDKGLGAVLLVCSGNWSESPLPKGRQFLSDEWSGLFLHALDDARRLGLKIDMNIAPGWNMGGPWLTPEAAGPLVVTPCASPLAKRKPKAGSESQPELF